MLLQGCKALWRLHSEGGGDLTWGPQNDPKEICFQTLWHPAPPGPSRASPWVSLHWACRQRLPGRRPLSPTGDGLSTPCVSPVGWAQGGSFSSFQERACGLGGRVVRRRVLNHLTFSAAAELFTEDMPSPLASPILQPDKACRWHCVLSKTSEQFTTFAIKWLNWSR